MIKFKFNGNNLKEARKLLAKYPSERKQSALMPFLTLAQKQNKGYLSRECLSYVANFLEIPEIKVYEVASFYTMYNLKPVGKYHIQLCCNVMCFVRGAYNILNFLEVETGTKVGGEISRDGLFSITKVECLGACCNAPMMQINDEYFEDLTKDNIQDIITNLKSKSR